MDARDEIPIFRKMIKPMRYVLTLLVLPVLYGQAVASVPRQGVIDLRQWDPTVQPVVNLSGEWVFYWDALLGAKDINLDLPVYAQLSIPWSEQVIGGKELPGNGFATYYLRILAPDVDSVAFWVPAVFNSYAFWVNDQLLAESGNVAADPSEMVPQWLPSTVSIPVTGDTLHVIFQIANFQNTRGGCAEVMRIGAKDHIERVSSMYEFSGLALIILFSLTGLSCCVIYFIFRTRAFLFLGLLAFAFALRFLFSDLYFYRYLLLKPSWAWVARLEYSSIPLIVVAGSFFMRSIYPQEFKRWALYTLVAINGVLIMVTVFAASSIFSPLLIFLQFAALMMLLYSLYVILNALIFGRKGALFSAFGALIFTLVGVYNIYAFLTLADLNRIIIHSGYAVALIFNVVSLLYRTPVRLLSEEQDILRFSDFYKEDAKV